MQRWNCNRRRDGVACKVNYSIKTVPIFANSKLRLQTFLSIFWHFVHRVSQKQARSFLDMDTKNNTIISNHYRQCRDICNDWIYKNWVPIGGEGTIAEVDESFFAGQQKYGKGKPTTWIFPWVFGIVMRGSLLVWIERVVERTRE